MHLWKTFSPYNMSVLWYRLFYVVQKNACSEIIWHIIKAYHHLNPNQEALRGDVSLNINKMPALSPSL